MNIKLENYIRHTLRNSEDIDITVNELYERFNKKEIQDLILDLYIIIKEQKTDKADNRKKYKYDTVFNIRNRNNNQHDIIQKLIYEQQYY